MGDYELLPFGDADSLAKVASTEWLKEVERTTRARAYLSVALAGGRIAKTFLGHAAKRARESRVNFGSVHFFWSDERCVPPRDPESNFLLAWESLLGPLGIPESQIHRIQGESAPERAVNVAEQELRQQVHAQSGDQPVLDLVFLGLGEDGHVASLFPEEPKQLIDDPKVFRHVLATKPPPNRITMGYPVIAAARQVWVLASGAGKQRALEDSLAIGGDTPLARILAQRSMTRIFTDLR